MRKIFRVLFTTMVLVNDSAGGMVSLKQSSERKVTNQVVMNQVVTNQVRQSLGELARSEGWRKRQQILSSVNKTVISYMSEWGADVSLPESTFSVVYKMLLEVMMPIEGASTPEASADSIAGYSQVLLTYCSIFSFNPLVFFDQLYQKLNDGKSRVTRKVIQLQVISQLLYSAIKREQFSEAEKWLIDFSNHLSSLLLSERESVHWDPGGMRGVLTFVGQSAHFSDEAVKRKLTKLYLESMWTEYGLQESKDQSRVQLMVGGTKPVIVLVNNLIILSNLNVDYDFIVKVLNAWKADKQRELPDHHQQLSVFYDEVVKTLLAVMREDLSHHFNSTVDRSQQAVACIKVIKAVRKLSITHKKNEDIFHIKSLIADFRGRDAPNDYDLVQKGKAFLTEFIEYAYLNYQDHPSYVFNFLEKNPLNVISSMSIIVVGMLLTKWVASPRGNGRRSRKIPRIAAKKQTLERSQSVLMEPTNTIEKQQKERVFYLWSEWVAKNKNVKTKEVNQRDIKAVCSIDRVETTLRALGSQIVKKQGHIKRTRRKAKKELIDCSYSIASMELDVKTMRDFMNILNVITSYYYGTICHGSRVCSVQGEVFKKFKRIINGDRSSTLMTLLEGMHDELEVSTSREECHRSPTHRLIAEESVDQGAGSHEECQAAVGIEGAIERAEAVEENKSVLTGQVNGPAEVECPVDDESIDAGRVPHQGASISVLSIGCFDLHRSPDKLFEKAISFQVFAFQLIEGVKRLSSRWHDFSYLKHDELAVNLSERFDARFSIILTRRREKANYLWRKRECQDDKPIRLDDDVQCFVLSQVKYIINAASKSEAFEEKKGILFYLMIALREIARSTPSLISAPSWEVMNGLVHLNEFDSSIEVLKENYWVFFTGGNVNETVLDSTLAALTESKAVDSIAPRHH